MSIVTKVVKNSFVYLVGEIIVRIITFFVTLILVRYLGSGNFGRYSLVYAFLSFFQIFLNMGVDQIIVRELSRSFQRGAELLGNAITLIFFSSLIGLLLCWTILPWIHYPQDLKFLIYLASLSMIFSFGALFNNIFQAQLLMKYIAAVTIVMKVLLAIFTLMLIFLKAKLAYFIILNLLISTAQAGFMFYQSRKFLQIRLMMDLRIWKELLKNSWPLAVSILFISIYTRINQVMLFSMKGKEELGFYVAALKFAEMPFIIVGAFMVSAFPLFSKYSQSAAEKLGKTYEKTLKYLMIFILPVAMMTMLYSKQIILACYGQAFLPAQAALAVLIWSTVFVYIATVYGHLLIATNLQTFVIIFTGSLAISNVLLNLILIPRFGSLGAAVATTVSYALGIPVSYLFKETKQFAKAAVKSMIKPFLAVLLAGYSVYFLSSLHLIFNLTLTGFIYLSLILFMREINSEDIKYGKEIFARFIT